MTKYSSAANNYPKEITDLIKQKRRARRRWQQSRHPDDKTVLNRLSLTLKRKIRYMNFIIY